MGTLNRERIPDWLTYADQIGLPMLGRGKWRNVRCDFHDDGTPSMRVNTETGGWICMSCGEKGGDTISHLMKRSGTDFVTAARQLGCWDEGAHAQSPAAPRRLSARDALMALEPDLNLCALVIADARTGVLPSNEDWSAFLEAAGRVTFVAREAA